jgi:hypothetical protein
LKNSAGVPSTFPADPTLNGPGVRVRLCIAGAVQPSGLLQFLPFAIILGIFLFLILLPMKKRQRKIRISRSR